MERNDFRTEGKSGAGMIIYVSSPTLRGVREGWGTRRDLDWRATFGVGVSSASRPHLGSTGGKSGAGMIIYVSSPTLRRVREGWGTRRDLDRRAAFGVGVSSASSPYLDSTGGKSGAWIIIYVSLPTLRGIREGWGTRRDLDWRATFGVGGLNAARTDHLHASPKRPGVTLRLCSGQARGPTRRLRCARFCGGGGLGGGVRLGGWPCGWRRRSGRRNGRIRRWL
jgi:hypothetical protein